MVNLNSLYQVIDVSGDDALSFLQGQLTCDMQEVISDKGVLTARCNRQGRMISLFYIVAQSSVQFTLIVPSTLVQITIDSLKQFIFRSKVSIKLNIDMSIAGDILNKNDLTLPSPFETKRIEKQLLLGLPGNRVLMLHFPPCKERDQNLKFMTQWQTLDIQYQLPWLCIETSEMFIPNEIKLETHQGLSFDKGCYIGQEIIARMHYLGKQKNQIHQITLVDNKTYAPGCDLFNKGEKLGRLICSIMLDDQRIGLAVLNSQKLVNQVESGSINLE